MNRTIAAADLTPQRLALALAAWVFRPPRRARRDPNTAATAATAQPSGGGEGLEVAPAPFRGPAA